MKITKGRFNSREMGLIVSTLLAVAGGYVKLIYFPETLRAAQAQERLESVEKELSWNKKILEAEAGVNSATAPAQKPVQKLLALNNNFGDLIRNLSGDSMAFTLNKLSLEKQEAGQGYTKNEFSLEIDSSFPDLGQFIEALERSDFIVEITSVEVSRISRELKKCTTKIRLTSYVARE